MAGRVAPKIVYDSSLVLYLDASNRYSYPGSGTTWNNLIPANNGTLVNSPVFSSNNAGSFLFDGTNEYMTTTLTNVGCNNTSMVIWYKWNGINQPYALTYLGDAFSTGYGLLINDGSSANAGNKISVLYGGTYYNALDTDITFGTLIANIYTQLTLTRDTTTTRLYQNGVYLGSTTRTPNSNTSTLSFNLGNGIVSAAGYISCIKFYNRSLSATEIQQNYNALKGRFGL